MEILEFETMKKLLEVKKEFGEGNKEPRKIIKLKKIEQG